MDLDRLQGAQYVRLAPGAAEEIARYIPLPSHRVDEIVLDLTEWPRDVRRQPRRARDGRLLVGDPVLIGAGEDGLRLQSSVEPSCTVLVPWSRLRSLEVLGVAAVPS